MQQAQQNREIRLTQISLVVTLVAIALLVCSTATVAWNALAEGQIGRLLEAILFGALAGFLVYGNLCYQMARIGQLKRANAHRVSQQASTASFDVTKAPPLTILVPSYKEEISVIRQTLLSAALQDYPLKRVVLLLDDPPAPKTDHERTTLWTSRSLPFDLQTLLREPAHRITMAQTAFLARRSAGTATVADECVRLSDCYRETTQWFELQAKGSPAETHTDIWFIEQVLSQPAETCREQGARWFARRKELCPGENILDEIHAAYVQLAARFLVDFDVFERKQYCNLSHEPNKAMNLNSYLGLMGKCVRPLSFPKGVALEHTVVTKGSRLIPDTPYVITLDADSLLTPHYARTLVELMERPEHARTAVSQTPYSAIPNAPGPLERTAGATTDIQYFVHQGFTHYGATFWVGANALLRTSALKDICVTTSESGITVRRFIQDRTVIEDTESTVDLLSKGWRLYNYPERLAYSATPPDFGSLVIQRARWANGGLIIFPKLVSFLLGTRKQAGTLPQALLQIHYLTSLAFAPLSVLLLLAIPFSSDLMTPWMPLSALPYFLLYARDLTAAGYRPGRDLLRIYALNLLLIPVHLGGALLSIRQAIAGTKIPFRRTPKISGRTRNSALDLTLQIAMVALSVELGLYYVSQMRWLSGAFGLLNAGLLLYGIRQFIGFAEMKQDLLLSIKETVRGLSREHARPPMHMVNRALNQLASGIGRTPLWPSTMRPKVFFRQMVWTIVVCLEVSSPALVAGEQSQAKNPILIENRRAGTRAWMLSKPARQGEIEGYASSTSVNQGETIRLYVNTTDPAYSIMVYRMGWYDGLGGREVLGPIRQRGHRQPAPFRDEETGLVECRWEHPIELRIPDEGQEAGWVSGYYLAKLTAEPTGHDSYIMFVVRDDARPSTYLVQSSVTTFQAYNNWGGRSLYAFNSPGGQAAQVSFDRPYAASAIAEAASGTGAGDFLTSNSIPSGAPVSAAGWEYNWIRWLEREGYDATYTTNLDVHSRADLLRSHKAFLSIGHDEYWSGDMRDHVEQARDGGVHLGFFSSNTCYWQIRLEPSRFTGDPQRTMVAYKENAPWHDPLFIDREPGNDHLVTTKWRNPPVNRPEASLMGSMFLEVETPVDGDLVLEDANGWMTEGTGLASGSHLRGVLGYEVDGISAFSPPNTHIVARSSVAGIEGVATLYRAGSGAIIFSSGSMQWSWGLDDYNAPQLRTSVVSHAVQQMTRNILDRFNAPGDEADINTSGPDASLAGIR